MSTKHTTLTTHKHLAIFLSVLLLLVPCALHALNTPPVASNVLVIIAHGNVRAMSDNDLRSLYTLRLKYLPNDGRARLSILPLDSQATLLFTDRLFNMFPYQLQRIWDTAVFSGRGKAPITFQNNQQIIDYVAKTEHAIGYLLIPSSEINELNEAVNVIFKG